MGSPTLQTLQEPILLLPSRWRLFLFCRVLIYCAGCWHTDPATAVAGGFQRRHQHVELFPLVRRLRVVAASVPRLFAARVSTQAAAPRTRPPVRTRAAHVHAQPVYAVRHGPQGQRGTPLPTFGLFVLPWIQASKWSFLTVTGGARLGVWARPPAQFNSLARWEPGVDFLCFLVFLSLAERHFMPTKLSTDRGVAPPQADNLYHVQAGCRTLRVLVVTWNMANKVRASPLTSDAKMCR